MEKLNETKLKGRYCEFPTIEKFLKEAFPNTTIKDEELFISDHSVIEILLKRKFSRSKKYNRLTPFMIYGERGCGKTVFAKLLKEIFRDDLAIVEQEGLLSSYNSHWADKKIVVIDEAVLKAITKDVIYHTFRSAEIKVEEKGRCSRTIHNSITFVILSERDELDILRPLESYFQIKMEKPSVIDLDAMVKEVPDFVKYLKK